jgi:hypothetical protein
MKRSNKHEVQHIVFQGLTGGIDISQAPENIADTDMQICQNFIYAKDSKRLTGRGGLSAPVYAFSQNIKSSYYDDDTDTIFLFLADGSIYSYVVGQIPSLLGALTGTEAPMCAKFMDKLWFASGGLLQYYDYGSLNTVTSSPTCDIAFMRFARLAVGQTGNDRLTLSAVGDGTSWGNVTDSSEGAVDSSAQWLDVGYGDTGNILSIVPIATDLIFIKSNGMVYQLIGDNTPSSWDCVHVASKTDPIGDMTAINVGNDVVFLSRHGLKALSTTQDYGNIAPSDIGDKFNGLLTNGMWEPQVFNLRRHRMMMIRPTADKTYWVAYNYQLGSATVLKFAIPITSMFETETDVYVTSGMSLYRWSEDYTDDNGVKIQYELKPHDVISTDEILVKSVDTKFSSDYAGTATVSAGTLSVNVETNTRNKIRCNHSTDAISLDVKSTDRFILDHISLKVAV